MTLLVGVLCACEIQAVGLSAYDVAVKNGFVGTEAEWLASLKGSDSGKSAYQIAVDNGFEGTEVEWLASLKGENGANGKNGKDGKDAKDVTIKDIYQAWLDEGNQGTFNEFIDEYLDASIVENDTEKSVSQAILSVVSVYVTFTKTQQVYVGGNFFGSGGHYEDQETKSSVAGAGVIYKLDKETGDAYVITNYHVVFDAEANTPNHVSQNITLYLYGRQRTEYGIPATFVGGALNFDIAVLKVEGSEILKESDAVACEPINSNDLTVGQTTIAIGNPEAKGISVTQGILSVDSEYMQMTGADNQTMVNFRTLRIDAPVNEGNSGGGLFNAYGQLIGIVNAKIINSSVESIGYAIPANIAVYVADNIIDNCDGQTSVNVKKCLLGVTVEMVESKAVYDEKTGLTKIVEVSRIKEINSTSILKDQIQLDDVLKKIKIGDNDEIEITRQFIVIDAMLTARVGDTIALTVERDGEEIVLTTVASETSMSIIQ
jgi:serine protease Do